MVACKRLKTQRLKPELTTSDCKAEIPNSRAYMSYYQDQLRDPEIAGTGAPLEIEYSSL